MKAVLLAGGLGTRLSEETSLKPKPMVDISGKPVLWHIMKIYSHYGINDFVICLGYKGYMIKEYFANYFLHTSDVTIDVRNSSIEVHQRYAEPWKVTLVDTGLQTMTGGRLKRVRPYLGDEAFCMTYGDGVADIDINQLIAFHRGHGGLATLTATKPPGRFGQLELAKDGQVTNFLEKPSGDGGWINGGFFVLEPKAMDYIDNDTASIWEREPLERLARDGQLHAFEHNGFWRPMDTLRDKIALEEMWDSGKPPWKVWS